MPCNLIATFTNLRCLILQHFLIKKDTIIIPIYKGNSSTDSNLGLLKSTVLSTVLSLSFAFVLRYLFMHICYISFQAKIPCFLFICFSHFMKYSISYSWVLNRYLLYWLINWLIDLKVLAYIAKASQQF